MIPTGILNRLRGQRTVHSLKTHPEWFQAIRSGVKPWEVRKDDRDFKVGDVLVLQEWDPIKKAYTGAALQAKVAYVANSTPGVRTGYVVMTLKGVRPW